MKAVILAGGLGTRISEETYLKPKPMVEIGGRPIIWHIMKIYSHYGINDFIICCGFKGYVIKEYFKNYFLHTSDICLDISENKMTVLRKKAEPWNVTLVDTGETTMTGGRLKRVRQYLENEDAFCFTYGDGLSNLNVAEEIAFHRAHGKLATVMAVQPPGRYGALVRDKAMVTGFREKPLGDGAWINGGFFVLSPRVIELIEGDADSWESKPMETLAASGQLVAFDHRGFWQPMDTLRDKNALEAHWSSGVAPWRVWS